MLYIKYFTEHHVVLSDGKEDYDLYAKSGERFDRDIIEDIVDYSERLDKLEGENNEHNM